MMIQYICTLCGRLVPKDRLVVIEESKTHMAPHIADLVTDETELHFHEDCWNALMVVTKSKIIGFKGE